MVEKDLETLLGYFLGFFLFSLLDRRERELQQSYPCKGENDLSQQKDEKFFLLQ